LMMSLWDALRMNMMISYQELVRTFPKKTCLAQYTQHELDLVAAQLQLRAAEGKLRPFFEEWSKKSSQI
ncbi:hypothetical protein, partial [Escherichia coli]|uniref:hypothetical protein n=1 Tax=Escherichia coli TaxID=562 RepID=UPI0038916219